VTPAAEHLFKIDKDAVKLDEEMGKVFHTWRATIQEAWLHLEKEPLCQRLQDRN
jgi:hypothetical protein